MSQQLKLEPLPSKTNKKLLNRLNRLRQSAGATKFQTIWRGHQSRKGMKELALKAMKIKESINDANKKNELQTFKDTPFDKLRSIQICVDAASGLLVSCTATNVSVKLFSDRRQQIGETASSVSQIESNPQSP